MSIGPAPARNQPLSLPVDGSCAGNSDAVGWRECENHEATACRHIGKKSQPSKLSAHRWREHGAGIEHKCVKADKRPGELTAKLSMSPLRWSLRDEYFRFLLFA